MTEGPHHGTPSMMIGFRQRPGNLARASDTSRFGSKILQTLPKTSMLRYTDVAWMDDRMAPSGHVRHNVEGSSAVFPPAYLLSFVTNHAGEPLHDSPDPPAVFPLRIESLSERREGEQPSSACLDQQSRGATA
jgi:hypothetical protein